MSYYDIIHSIVIRFVGNAVVQISYIIHTHGVSGYPTRVPTITYICQDGQIMTGAFHMTI